MPSFWVHTSRRAEAPTARGFKGCHAKFRERRAFSPGTAELQRLSTRNGGPAAPDRLEPGARRPRRGPLVPRRQTDVDRLRLAGKNLDGRGVRPESILPHFDAVRAGSELHDETAAALRAVPALA